MMLLVNVDQRFSAMQVLEHPWVNVSDFYPYSHFQIACFMMLPHSVWVLFAFVLPSQVYQIVSGPHTFPTGPPVCQC